MHGMLQLGVVGGQLDTARHMITDMVGSQGF
jgi:hypothetical protein